jgi:hypothetical protein
VPLGHGSYRGLELEQLDPSDEEERVILLEGLHAGHEDASGDGGETGADGGPFNPRLHIMLHQIVANQLLADDPPVTWQTVRRLAALGYDWHTIMHMIARLVGDDVYRVMHEHRAFDAGDYARRLDELPGHGP